MSLTLILGIILGAVLIIDLSCLCYKTGKQDKISELDKTIDDKRYLIQKLTELQNNIKHNFPELDLETLTLEELVDRTSDNDYVKIYQRAYHDSYYDAFNNISKEFNKLKEKS